MIQKVEEARYKFCVDTVLFKLVDDFYKCFNGINLNVHVLVIDEIK